MLIWIPASACAQLPQPKLDWIYPPGGQRGTQVEITVGGTDLDEGRELVFSHPNISARPKRTAADEFYPEGQPIANQFTIEIGSDVPPGLTTPGCRPTRRFHVRSCARFGPYASCRQWKQPHRRSSAAGSSGSLVSGRADAEQLDYYAVELAGGEELTCEVWAQRIDSQAEIWIELCRTDGAPLRVKARARASRSGTPLHRTAAAKYFIRVQDATFRGGDPFIYRLAVHNGSSIESESPEGNYPIAVQPRGLDAEGMATVLSRAGTEASRTRRRLSGSLCPAKCLGGFPRAATATRSSCNPPRRANS